MVWILRDIAAGRFASCWMWDIRPGNHHTDNHSYHYADRHSYHHADSYYHADSHCNGYCNGYCMVFTRDFT